MGQEGCEGDKLGYFGRGRGYVLEPLKGHHVTQSFLFFYFLKRSPKPAKGQRDSLSSDIAALKSKSPVRACRSLSPSVFRAQ